MLQSNIVLFLLTKDKDFRMPSIDSDKYTNVLVSITLKAHVNDVELVKEFNFFEFQATQPTIQQQTLRTQVYS